MFFTNVIIDFPDLEFNVTVVPRAVRGVIIFPFISTELLILRHDILFGKYPLITIACIILDFARSFIFSIEILIVVFGKIKVNPLLNVSLSSISS